MVRKALIFPRAHVVTFSITSSLQSQLPGVCDHTAGRANPIMTASIDCSLISIQGPLARWKLWPVKKKKEKKELHLFSVNWSGEGTEPETAWVLLQLLEVGSQRAQDGVSRTFHSLLEIAAMFQSSHAAPWENIRLVLLLFRTKLRLHNGF